MRYLYVPTVEKMSSPEEGEYTAYGIRVLQVTPHGVRELQYIPDVSLDCVRVSELTARCTEGQLSPIHLADVIEDNL